MAKDAGYIADKWARRLSAATDDIRTGVEALQESPMEKAVQKKDRLRQRLIEAIDSGKWENNLLAVSLQEWKQKLINKGLPRIAQGVNESKDLMQEFFSQLLPHIQEGLAELQNMPDVTLEDSINRVTFWIRHMSQFKFMRRRR